MNVKLGIVAALLLAACIIVPLRALAIDFYMFSDPLRAMPPLVEKGPVLPGDSTPVPRSIEKDFSQPLTLSEVVDLALSNNPKTKLAWADIKIQANALGGANAQYLPTLNGSVNWTKDKIDYSDPRYPSTDTNRYTGQVSAVWRILDFGGRSANKKAAKSTLAAAIASFDATLQGAMAGAIKAYFDAMTAKASLDAKTKDADIANSILASAKEREAKGAISQSDTLRAATALAKANLDENRTFGDYQKALAVLRYQLGLAIKTELVLPQGGEEQLHWNAENKELSLWLQDAQKKHPAILAAREQLEAARQQVKVTRSAGLPVVNLYGNYYQNTRPGEAVTPGVQETTLSVALSVPIFDGFTSTYKVRGAEAQVEKQAASLADTERQIAMGIIKAYADMTSSLRNLDASKTLLESARASLEVSQRKYAKGAADITEVLSTQSALADALNERVRCVNDWYSARLQLLATAGSLGRSALVSLK